MRKLFYTLLIFLGFAQKQFGQDSTSSLKKWNLIAGTNMLIPIREFKETHLYAGVDDIEGEFNVKPIFTANNYFVSITRFHLIPSYKKSGFDMSIGGGYQHYERKNHKQGEYGGGNTAYNFIGNIDIATKDDYLFLEWAFINSRKITKKINLTNQIDISGNLLFHQLENRKQYGIETNNAPSAYTYMSSDYDIETWRVKTIDFFVNYRVGVEASLTNRICISSQIETPLLLINSLIWKMNYDRKFPHSSTPYFTSINKIYFLSARIFFSYKI